MTSLYLRTDDDTYFVLAQIFLGVTYEVESDDVHEDHTHTIHATWRGNCFEQVKYRCDRLDEVIDYQIFGDAPKVTPDIDYW